MRMRNLAVALAILAAGGAGAYSYMRGRGTANLTAGALPVGEVRRGAFVREVSAMGALRAADSATVRAPFYGKILRIVDEGSQVRKGDPVLWLDTTDIEKGIEEFEANLALAEKDLAAAQEDFRLTELKNRFDLETKRNEVTLAEQSFGDSRRRYEAERELVARSVSPKTKEEEARLAMLEAEVRLRNSRIDLRKTEENVESNLRLARNRIERSQIEVDRNRRRLQEERDKAAQATLTSPADGEVNYLQIWKNGTNARIAAGDQVWDELALLEIPNTSTMLAVVPVHELDISLVQPGQRAFVEVEALPGRVFEGKVARKSIVPSSENQRRPRMTGGSQQQGPREFDVFVELSTTDPTLRQGMTATARIEIASLPDVLQVPIEAITRRDGKTGVVEQASREFVPVEVLDANTTHAAVKGALRAGQRIFLRDPDVSLPESVGTGSTPIASEPIAPVRGGPSREGGPPRGEGRRGEPPAAPPAG